MIMGLILGISLTGLAYYGLKALIQFDNAQSKAELDIRALKLECKRLRKMIQPDSLMDEMDVAYTQHLFNHNRARKERLRNGH